MAYMPRLAKVPCHISVWCVRLPLILDCSYDQVTMGGRQLKSRCETWAPDRVAILPTSLESDHDSKATALTLVPHARAVIVEKTTVRIRPFWGWDWRNMVDAGSERYGGQSMLVGGYHDHESVNVVVVQSLQEEGGKVGITQCVYLL